MSSTNVTYMRCHKVEKALEADKTIRRMLGPKDQVMHKPPNNTPCKFSEEVIVLTELIHSKGSDAHTMTQREIMSHAIPFFRDLKAGKPMPKREVAVVVEESSPVARVKSKARVRVKAKPKVVAKTASRAPPAPVPAPLPEPEIEPEVEPEPIVEATNNNNNHAPVAEPEVKKHEAEQYELPVTREPTQKKPKPVTGVEQAPIKPVLDESRTAPAGKLPFVWGVSVNTLLLACLQLLEVHQVKDTSLVKRLEELSNDVSRMTVIPRESNAKESQNSLSRNAAS